MTEDLDIVGSNLLQADSDTRCNSFIGVLMGATHQQVRRIKEIIIKTHSQDNNQYF